MRLFIAQGDCGDYYCDREHVLGVFSTRERAEEIADRYRKIGLHTDASVGEYTVDEVIPDPPGTERFTPAWAGTPRPWWVD